jgi:hypothetical protein
VDDLVGLDPSKLLDQLLNLLTDPTSNLQAALILYGMIALVVAIVLVVGVILLMGLPDDEYEEVAPSSAGGGREAASKPPTKKQDTTTPRGPAARLISTFVMVCLLVAVWVVAGYTTSRTDTCGACHVTTVHDEADDDGDPHASSECVSCHESGSQFGRYVTDVPVRMVHFVEGSAGLTLQAVYGHVTTSSCDSCHAMRKAGTTINKVSGIRMSHEEPLDAAATCLYCHKPIKGLVTRQTIGMNSCLRCHDSQVASAECTTCHDTKTAAAVRASSTEYAKEQVVDIKCGGCHNEVVECDSCHGSRMPHSLAFKAGVHARAGAVDFWFNEGKGCARCHTETRRPCTRCHNPILGKGHPASQATVHQDATADRCTSCHIALANPKNRDWCDLCHSELALSESPR